MSRINFPTNGLLFEPGEEWTGYTTKRHLANIRQIQPKFGSDIMTYIGSANTQSMAYEEYLKMVTKVTYRDTDDPVPYMVYGEGRQFATLLKVIAEDMNRIGFNKSEFTMVFDAPFFSEVHLIVGMSDRYIVRISRDGVQAHGGWAYKCTVFGAANNFLPPSEAKIGSTWTKEGAPVPLYNSEKGARVSYSSPYAITYTWSSVSVEDQVPGNMTNRPVVFAWKDAEGKPMWTWEQYRTYTNDMDFRLLKNKALVWGRSNMNEAGGYDDIDNRSGVEITYGSGSMEQQERGNIFYYNSFDIDEFGDQIMKLRVGKQQTDITHYVVSTGTYGMTQAQNSIASKAQGWEKVDNKSIFGDAMNLGFGHRFTRYLHPGGFYIDFRYEALFDDQYRTPVRHPNGGFSRSYEYHITDLGTTQGDSSMELNYVKGMSDNLTIVEGARSPFVPYNNSPVVHKASSTKDTWEERRISQFMLVLKNPRNSLIYRPNILR